jgi:glycosyltransferase involved in cell wall biosynthesis
MTRHTDTTHRAATTRAVGTAQRSTDQPLTARRGNEYRGRFRSGHDTLRVLYCGPTAPTGSLGPYVTELATELRRLGHHLTTIGTNTTPFDVDQQQFWSPETVVAHVEALAGDADPDDHDLVVYHYGNLEMEQLLPYHWHASTTPSVYHVHTLGPTLFQDHIGDPGLAARVTDGLAAHDGYVYFGSDAQRAFAHHRPGALATVAYHPGTNPPPDGPARPSIGADLATALASDRPRITQLGFASPWKNVKLLQAALRRVDIPVHAVLAGPFWDDPDQAGAELVPGDDPVTYHGHSALVVVARYLDRHERHHLIRSSAAGVFPYQDHPSHQGSGSVSEYLARARPVIATATSNMVDVVGQAGIIVPADDPDRFAAALDAITADRYRARAVERAELFSARRHARRCAQLYTRVAAHRSARTTG